MLTLYLTTYVQTVSIYGTAQFKLDICTRVLASTVAQEICDGTHDHEFPQAHDLWHAFDPPDELYTREVRSSVDSRAIMLCVKQYTLQAITLHVKQHVYSLSIQDSSCASTVLLPASV